MVLESHKVTVPPPNQRGKEKTEEKVTEKERKTKIKAKVKMVGEDPVEKIEIKAKEMDKTVAQTATREISWKREREGE